MVHSLYNGIRGRDGVANRPTKAQLKGIDAIVIDLQDIGSRSYTFIGAMKVCMEGCFENGVEVVVLDRPNPLGGLKVDGPPLDPQWEGNYVSEFRVPYVHGLTMGELARLAKEAPDLLRIPDAMRENGKAGRRPHARSGAGACAGPTRACRGSPPRRTSPTTRPSRATR